MISSALKAIVLILPLFVIGCGPTKTISISSKPIEIEVGKTADPQAVTMLPVQFRVITKENLDSFLAEMSQRQGSSPVFLAMTIKDYENIVLNLADLRRYIEQQQAVIAYYRNMTDLGISKTD